MDFFLIKEELKYQAQRIFQNKVYLSIFLVFVLVFSSGAYFYFDYKNGGKSFLSNYFSAPKIISANFDLDYKKIPQNIPYIELEFNKKLDAKNIPSDALSISPKIDGKVSVVDNTKIRYTFSKASLAVGSEIEVNLKDNLKTRAGESLPSYSSFLQIAEAPKVVKITPQTDKNKDSTILSNLSSHINVFFNVPMLSLTDLDSQDKLPCLIDIEPKIDGKCIWTTTSMLEFIPDKPIPGSSQFNITVSNKDGLLYNLSKEEKTFLQTTNIDFFINEEENYDKTYNFSASKGVKFTSNFPVSTQELKKNIVLQNAKGESVNFNIEKDKNSDSSFSLVSDSFKYTNNYSLTFKSGIKADNTNMGLKKSLVFKLKSRNFINSINTYKKTFSSTGQELDPIYTTSLIYNLANKNAYLDIYLDDEAILSKDIFKFSKSDQKSLNYDLEYYKDTYIDDKGVSQTKDDKKHIILTIRSDLDLGSEYKLTVSKQANKQLENDLIYSYKTAPNFKVLDYKYLGYNKACLYTNSYLGFSGTTYSRDYSSNFSYTPNAKIFSIGEYEAGSPDKDYFLSKTWQEQEAFNTLDEATKNQKLLQAGLCPMAKSGQILYVINHRLNPNSSYKFELSTAAKDLFDNPISLSFYQTIKTGNDIKEIDKYVYTTISKDVSVIPKTASIVVPVQTINLDKINLEVCEMDNDGYLDYISNVYSGNYSPKCVKNTKKELSIKNNYWNLTYSKFDLEKDVILAKSDAPYILVRGYRDNFGSSQENGRSFQNLFIRSDIQAYLEAGGGDEKTGSNKSLLFVTDFAGNPVQNATIEAYSRVWNGNNSTFSKTTLAFKYSKDGVYVTNATNFNDIVLIIKSGDKQAVITSYADQAGNYDFGYDSGIDSFTKDFLYLYTDRPLYKAGDTVYFKGLARTFSIKGYKGVDYKSGKLELLDENYKTIKSIDVKLDKNSNFAGSFELSKEAAIGKYNFRFTVNGQEIINNASFDIEEYIKPVFKVSLSQEKKDFTLGEETKIKVNPEYYFGGKLISTKGTYSVLVQNYFFDGKEFGDYQFGEGDNYFSCLYWGYCSYNDNLVGVKDFNVDENGNYDLNYKFSDKLEDGEKLYTITAEVEDPDTKKTVSNSLTDVLHNTDAYIGIKLPWYSTKKSGLDLVGVILDYDAKALEGKTAKIEVYKREYKSVKKQGVDGNFYYDYSFEDKLENSFDIKSDNSGKFTKNIKTNSDGEYFIKAIYTGKNGKSFISSRELYVSGDSYVEWNNGNNDITELSADKTILNPGDTANFTLKSPVKSGKALVIVEKDDGILDYAVFPINSYAQRISFPVKDSYYPNFYTKVFLIGNGNGLPVYKRALSQNKVTTGDKKLNVSISRSKQNYLPQEKLELTVKVTDSRGNAVANANGSIAVVDESLLALLGNPKKNPFAFFYEMKRYLGTLTYISLKNLVEKLEVKDIRDGEKGGAGDQVKGGDSSKKRGVFKDTAYWKSDFTTDKNGIFKITTDALPDNLTTWDIETIVSSPDNKIGIARTSVSTNKKVMISDNLPAFLGSSDKITFSPVIFNKTGIDQNFIVSFSGTNLNQKNSEEKIFIKNKEQKTINFEATVAQNNMLANLASKIDIKAIAETSKDSDEIEKTLEIKNTYTREVVASAGSTSSSKTEYIDLKNIISYPGYLSFNYSSTLLSNLTDGIDYLNSYPYGCSEQKTSSLMPNIFIKELYNQANIKYDLKEKMIDYYAGGEEGYKKKSLDNIIKDYLVDIKKFQKDNGGFGYWKDLSVGNNYADFALTSYIISSISEIKSIGYDIDIASLDRSLKYLKTRFYKNNRENCVVTKYNDCKYSEIERLKAIQAIINYNPNDYEAYKMYKLIDFKSNTISSFSLENAKTMVLLHANAAKIGIDSKGDDALRREIKSILEKSISENLVYSPRGAFIAGNEDGNRIENTSNLVYLISKAGLENFKDSKDILENILRWMIRQKSDTGFGSTADNIDVIKAFTTYLNSSGELKDVNMQIKALLNNSEFVSQKYNNDNKLISLEETKDFKNLKENNTLQISKTGTGGAYYDMNLVYFKPSKDIKARNSGFFLKTKYFDYNDYKKIEILKNEEWTKYLSGEISYEQLKYPNEISSYLQEVSKSKIGQLLVVYNKIIVSETRDKVAFEGFIPSGAEIVNPHFATSTAKSREFAANFFDRTEYRLDRFFAYKGELEVGNYDFIYLIRATHSGTFNLKPAQIYEFYTPEVFGRTTGREFEVE